MRIVIAGFAVLAVTLLGHSASADAPSLRTIPQGKLPSPPVLGGPPTSIPATEKVDGFFVVRRPEPKLSSNPQLSYTYKYAVVTSSESLARDIESGRSAGNLDPENRRSCFSANGSTSTSSMASLSMYIPKVAPPPKPKKGAGGIVSAAVPYRPRNVQFVRAERFSEEGGGRIDITDAWVDINTLGARLVSKSTVPLANVGTGPSGVQVFAARNEKTVDFIVRQPARADKSLPSHIAAIPGRLTAQTPSGFGSTGDCGHLRVSLQFEQGGGQMASVFGTAFLPPAPDDDVSDERARPRDPDDDDDDDDEPRVPQKHDVRSRPFVANLSVSQTKSEKEPIVSVSFGWSGKDQHSRF